METGVGKLLIVAIFLIILNTSPILNLKMTQSKVENVIHIYTCYKLYYK